LIQEKIVEWSQRTGVEPGLIYGTRNSVGTAPDTHALDPDQNTIKENGALLKNAQQMANGWHKWMVEN
jgi:hypothetical protein